MSTVPFGTCIVSSNTRLQGSTFFEKSIDDFIFSYLGFIKSEKLSKY